MILYGIAACDTCRKAHKALEAAGHEVRFHDVRKAPLSPETLAGFHAELGDGLLNKSSTTWRGLDEVQRARPVLELLAEHPTLMKRPVIDGPVTEGGDRLTLGWTKAVQEARLGAA